jgi:hypothetical protein
VSWDVFIMKFPPEITSIDEIPDDWDPPSLGTGSEVSAVLAGILPGIEYSEDGWGDYEGPGFSISTPIGDRDGDCDCVALFVHGDSGGAAHAALAVADALNARAVDTGSGEFLTADSARPAFEAWRAYRDQVLGSSGA